MSRRAGRRRPPKRVEHEISRLLGDLGLSDQARWLEIRAVWLQAVGERIAAVTSPHSFNRGLLTVGASSPAWQNELTFLKPQIVDKLNELLGRALVKDMRVQSGKILGRPTARRRKAEPTPGDRQRAEVAAAVITDPELRGLFERAMSNELWRQRHDSPSRKRERTSEE